MKCAISASYTGKTPGHPEYKITPGVETTTGPLGQGIANAVGMALAEKLLADEFNQAEIDIIDHYTYVFLGDGCLMEGISHEACSLAGTLKLGKLIAFYDDNGISIDGQVAHWFADDSKQRFAAYGWQVLSINGHDAAAIHQAILEAKSNTQQPTLICAKTTIGMGSPNKAGSHSVHGSALGEDEVVATRENCSTGSIRPLKSHRRSILPGMLDCRVQSYKLSGKAYLRAMLSNSPKKPSNF